MEITNSFLEVVSDLLSSKGYFYLVALKTNDIDVIRQKMLAKFNLQSEVSKDCSAWIEFHVSSRIDCPRTACGKRTSVHNSICSDLKVEASLEMYFSLAYAIDGPQTCINNHDASALPRLGRLGWNLLLTNFKRSERGKMRLENR